MTTEELPKFPDDKELALFTVDGIQRASFTSENRFADAYPVIYREREQKLDDGAYSSSLFEYTGSGIRLKEANFKK